MQNGQFNETETEEQMFRIVCSFQVHLFAILFVCIALWVVEWCVFYLGPHWTKIMIKKKKLWKRQTISLCRFQRNWRFVVFKGFTIKDYFRKRQLLPVSISMFRYSPQIIHYPLPCLLVYAVQWYYEQQAVSLFTVHMVKSIPNCVFR